MAGDGILPTSLDLSLFQKCNTCVKSVLYVMLLDFDFLNECIIIAGLRVVKMVASLVQNCPNPKLSVGIFIFQTELL